MKKLFLTFFLAVAAITSCQRVDSYCPAIHYDVLTARIEQDEMTRTAMDVHNNVLWSENDRISAFLKSSYGREYQVVPSFVGKNYADFAEVASDNDGHLSAGTSLDHIVAYYPYDETVECLKNDNDYVLEVTLPSSQPYALDSFASGFFPMVAVSEDDDLTFRNVCGGIRLNIKGNQTVTSIKIEGKDSEKISGPAKVTAFSDGSAPVVTMSDGASAYVSLDCGTGVHLSEDVATEFIAVMPPVKFNKGFTVTITLADGETHVVHTDAKNEVFRSSLLDMPEIAMEASQTQVVNYVDEYGINHGPGVKIGETVWAPVNCGYHKDDFKYGKYYQWGRKYGQGYIGSLNDDGTLNDDSDAVIPIIVDKKGGASLTDGQSEKYKNVFFANSATSYDSSDYYKRYWGPRDTDLWPVKYNPCPEGWQVPSLDDINELQTYGYSQGTSSEGLPGIWFSSSKTYSESSPRIFFPFAGYINPATGWGSGRGTSSGHVSWTSDSNAHNRYTLYIPISNSLSWSLTAYGYPVRCVQK